MAKSKKKQGPPRLTEHLEESLFFQFHQLNRMFREAADNTLADFNLNQRAYWLLECLDPDHGYSQTELGTLLGVDRSDMVRLLDSVEKEAWVTRVRSADDRRKQLVKITKEGMKQRQEVRSAIEKAEEELLDRLGNKQEDRLRKYVSKITDDIVPQ